jgi:anthranilate/para-aminobenzoate synthase component II
MQALVGLLQGMPEQFTVGRYHPCSPSAALSRPVLSGHGRNRGRLHYGDRAHRPCHCRGAGLHPESVMTSPGEVGMPVLEAALSCLCETVAA